MAAVETVATSLNGNFKNVYGDKIFDLVPESDILYRNDRIKFVSKKGREGLQFNQPVMVALRHRPLGDSTARPSTAPSQCSLPTPR